MFNLKTLLILVMITSTVAKSVELEGATNDQLLYEVSRRMNGGGSASGATASFTCASNGWLSITLSGSSGTKEKYLNTGSYENCLAQAADLRTHKSKVSSYITGAGCQYNGWLSKFLFRPDGAFGDDVFVNVGSYANCIAQAKEINAQ